MTQRCARNDTARVFRTAAMLAQNAAIERLAKKDARISCSKNKEMTDSSTETQRHRETTTETTKTQRSGEQEGFLPPFHFMLSSVPLCLCGELFLGFLRALHRLLPAMFMH